MNVKIIKLPPERWEEYKKIRLEYLQEVPEAFTSSYEEKVKEPSSYWQKKLEYYSGNQALILFAEVNGKLVGIAAAYVETPLRIKHVGFFNTLYVKKEFRRKGIAKKLAQEIMEWFTSKNLVKIKLEVTTSQPVATAFYKTLGFEIAGELKKEIQVDDKFYNVYTMEKYLK